MASQKMLNQYPPVLSVKQVAEILAVSLNTAYVLVRSKQIQSIRVGRSYRILLDSVIKYLSEHYGECWIDNGFVFTDDFGNHLSASSVYKAFKQVVEEIGSPETRFHDLRHSYAVAAIKSGDDIKTVQEKLGHATAAFTLDVYGHVTEKMKQESAARMEQFINAVNK